MNKMNNQFRASYGYIYRGLCSLLLCLLFILTSSRSYAEEQPNIIVIVADDMGYSDLDAFGENAIETPHLDRLAREGALATAFYTASPICTPARAAVFTGRYPQRYGFTDKTLTERTRMGVGIPQDEFYISQALNDTGYRTGAFGKWNQGFAEGSRPTERGFDTFLGNPSGGIYYFEGEYEPTYSYYRDTEPIQIDGYSTTKYTDALLEFVDEHKSEPFFAHIAYTNPHSPVDPKKHKDWAPREFLEMYENVNHEKRRQYMASITAMDAEIGRILQKLDEEGLTDETLVIFFSDNGGDFAESNEPFRGTKKNVEEGGIRVPLIVRRPGQIPAGTRTDVPMIGMDLYPLMLHAGNATRPADAKPLDGVNPLPALSGASEEPLHDALFWDFRGQWAVRRGDYKLSDEGLYHLPSDPKEQNDLSQQMPDLKRELRELYSRWKQAVQQ
jgi:arylsulfatase A-like enzyme